MAPISPLSSRQVPANRCSISSFVRTVFPLIQANGGWLAKAKRFADDAQDLTYSSRRGRRSGRNVAGDPAAHELCRLKRQGGGGGHLPPAQSVRRRVRARARRLRREAGRQQA